MLLPGIAPLLFLRWFPSPNPIIRKGRAGILDDCSIYYLLLSTYDSCVFQFVISMRCSSLPRDTLAACCTQEINRPSLVASCLGAFCNELFAQCSTSRSDESQCDIGVAFAVPLLFCILFERRAADVDLANSHSDGRRIAFDRLKSC